MNASAHIIVPEKEVRVVRADQIVAGGVYRVVGTTLVPDEDRYGNIIENSFSRKPMPPQIVIAQGPVQHFSSHDIGHVPVFLYADAGFQGTHGFFTTLGLDQVNIPEHGDHDVHLEKVPESTVLEWVAMLQRLNRQQDYTEEIMDRGYWKFTEQMGGKEE